MNRRRRIMPWERLAYWTVGARSDLHSHKVRIEYPTHIYYAAQSEWVAEVQRLGAMP